MNGAACDSFQFVRNCIFLAVQITCNTCYTYDVPTESKSPMPVDLDFFNTFAGYNIYRYSMMTVVQISLKSLHRDLIFDLLECIL